MRRFRQAEAVLWRNAGDGRLVLLAVAGGAPVVLSGPGRLLWEALAEPRSLEEVAADLELDGLGREAAVHEDISSLVEDLCDRDLLVVSEHPG